MIFLWQSFILELIIFINCISEICCYYRLKYFQMTFVFDREETLLLVSGGLVCFVKLTEHYDMRNENLLTY